MDGVVAADGVLEARSPLPARRWTQSSPLTPGVSPSRSPVTLTGPGPATPPGMPPAPPTSGLSILYLRNSEGLISMMRDLVDSGTTEDDVLRNR